MEQREEKKKIPNVSKIQQRDQKPETLDKLLLVNDFYIMKAALFLQKVLPSEYGNVHKNKEKIKVII